MKIYITRHGQTRYNKQKLMQGLTDEPLNEKGIEQAKGKYDLIKNVHFDAIYASPLIRAVQTASYMSGVDQEQIIRDPRIIETDFGKYELCPYTKQGPAMTLYWMFPELFPAPATVETTASMIERSHAFLKEIEQMPYENVLIVCHGGIIRALCGYLEERRNGLKWRPRPKNSEIRVYEYKDGKHTFIETI